jgi:protein-disulfide isomerase
MMMVRFAFRSFQSLFVAVGLLLLADVSGAVHPVASAAAQDPTPDATQRLRVPVADAPALGPADALVTIVVFSEFQCPFCARVVPTLDALSDRYGDDLRIVFRHMPLEFHENARTAAHAAVAAHLQGRFWEFHDMAFANQRAIDPASLLLQAELLSLDTEWFVADRDSAAVHAVVDADVALAESLGVRGTPHFFVNGMGLSGAQPLDVFVGVVDTELAHAQSLVDAGTPREQVYDTIMAAADTEIRWISPPGTPDRNQEVRVPVAGFPTFGPDDALVTMVMFADFQCPFSSRVVATLVQLKQQYGDDLRLVYRHYPLAFHDQAVSAARASWAAQQQGQFWPMFDWLFANQMRLGPDVYVAMAGQLGMDIARFGQDMNSAAAQQAVDADLAEAQRVGVQGTPNFYINGRLVAGAQPIEEFQRVIDATLTEAQALVDAGTPRADVYAALQADALETTPVVPPAAAPGRPTPDPSVEMWVPLDDAAVLGSASALVTIVIFTEFQCPFCARVTPTLQRVQETYGDDVRLVFRHRPLDFHDRALPAARAAVAAQQQGRFWEYSDLLWENQTAIQDADLEGYAEQLGLDIQQFRADRDSAETQARIEADIALAERLAANGTPHFFVNGIRLRGAQPYEAFVTMIDAQLAIARQAIEDGADADAIYEALQADAERGPAPMLP